MPRPIGVLRFVNVFVAAIAAGTLTAMQVGLVPLVRSIPEGTGLAVRRAFEGRIDRYEPVCVVLSAAVELADPTALTALKSTITALLVAC